MVTDLSINLADPQEVRAKMPEIKGLLAEARRELRALEDQVELLSRIVGEKTSTSAAAAATGGRSASARTRKTSKGRVQKAAPSQERAVRALEKAGRRMGPAELFRFMEAEGIQKPASVAALNAILWAASNTGRVVKAPGNVYEPPGGFPSTSSDGTTQARQLDNNGLEPPAAAQHPSPAGLHPAGGTREIRLESAIPGA